VACSAWMKSLARDYYRLTGKPLGVTGEVAEYEAAHILRIELTPVRQADYDAIERRNGSIRRLQIKDAVCYVIANRVSAMAGLIPRRIGMPS
jgi:hypothetical protein